MSCKERKTGMGKVLVVVVCLLSSMLLSGNARAQNDTAKYEPKVDYPLFKEIEKRDDSLQAEQDSITAAIRKRQKAEKELADSTKQELRFDVSGIDKPGAPEEFATVFHFPPTPQDWSSTCWSFSGTSFLESEVFRLTGHKIKLSEMYTVYFEYLEKVRRFIRERGDSRVGPGSEEEAVPRIMKLYGAVPRDVYDGLDPAFPHYDHTNLERELDACVDYIEGNDLWDEDAALARVRIILDKYIGKPPENFKYDGKTYTPREFVALVLKVNPDDYVCAMSTLKVPFYTRGLFDVGDNWQRDSSYLNLPLDVWYDVLRTALQRGYSVALGGGISEPGYYGAENVGVIPDFDIPQDYINQNSREYRIYRHVTGDDHGLHVVGFLRKGDRDWFLVKDSGSGSRRWGRFRGYFFFRDDFVRLKMLTIMVHKDIIESVAGSN